MARYMDERDTAAADGELPFSALQAHVDRKGLKDHVEAEGGGQPVVPPLDDLCVQLVHDEAAA